jgi:hypothetical protein
MTHVMRLAVVGALIVAAVFARQHGRPAAIRDRQVGQISAAERAATLSFDPAIAPSDRTAILTAIADARPPARALIDAVDGLVDVHVATTAAGTVGTTGSVGNRYAMMLDLGSVARRYGQRGIDRLVLHELGHVVDFALVPAALDARLDAAIPRGYGCEDGLTGACATADERFAESFAKWATGDIGAGIDIGYKIPPPDDLDAWGAPLAALLRA